MNFTCNSRYFKVEKSLQHQDKITTELKLIESRNRGFNLPSTSYCCICKRKFNESTFGFVRFPNGVIAHINCAPNRKACPLTGHLFQIDT